MLLKKRSNREIIYKERYGFGMTILMEKETDYEIGFDYGKLLKKVVAKSIELENCPYECEVNITFTDDNGIRLLNRDFRGLDVPTDVLSFPMAEYVPPADFSMLEEEGAAAAYFNPGSGELLLGDIVISLERADEQAKQYGHSLKREICFLTAHSMLHLMGYDHMAEEERKVMEDKQEEILNALGITRD